MALSKFIGTKIKELLSRGISNAEIAELLDCSSATVTYHKGKLGLPKISSKKEIDWSLLQCEYDCGATIRNLAAKYKTTVMTICKHINTRSPKEAHRLLHMHYKPSPKSAATREKHRQVMLRRRANGYNWTLAHSTMNGISYPEQFWMEVIKNEFVDKNYQFNMPFGRFALDFAWPHKKKVIEIDGEQHYTQPIQRERDRNKEALLKAEGWLLLRLRWKKICGEDTKYYIRLAVDFIGD